MKIQPINRNYNSNYASKNPNFKGIIGKVNLFRVENYAGDYLHELQIMTYYQFQDDSPKELEELRSKCEFSSTDTNKPLPSETIRFQKAAACDIETIKVPLTMEQYKKYLDYKLTPDEVNKIERTLKDNDLGALLKKKLALVPIKGNLYKSIYLPWF